MRLWGRGAALAALSGALAAGSHAAAGGAAPGLAVLLMVVVLVPIMAALLALTTSLLALTGVLIGLQVGAHVWLGALHPHAGAPAGRAPVLDHAAHASGASASGGAGHAPGILETVIGGTQGPMLWAHVAAIVATVAFWGLMRPLADALVRLLAPVGAPHPPPRRPRVLGVVRDARRVSVQILSGVLDRRGPPVLA